MVRAVNDLKKYYIVIILINFNLFAQNNFSFIILPDTQYYPSNKNGGTIEIFKAQTKWIVEKKMILI